MNIKIHLRADCGRTDFNRTIKPSDASCHLDAKQKFPRRLFKKQKHQTSPFRQHLCHFRQKLYNRYFLTVETNVRPSGWTAEGRPEQTDKQSDNPNGLRTSVGCERPSDIGWLRRWAIGRNLWLYTGNIPAIVGKSSFSMRPARRQTVPNGRHKLPRNRKRKRQAQVWLHLSRTKDNVYGSSNHRKENL